MHSLRVQQPTIQGEGDFPGCLSDPSPPHWTVQRDLQSIREETTRIIIIIISQTTTQVST